jgi:hypothetical protein
MKVKVETALFMVPFGSHLYGTNGPNSDLDFKLVCLPSLADLLLNKQVTNRKVLPEGKKDGEKMSVGEAEYEYIPLQVFLNDFIAGQTYALEIAFAVLQEKVWFEGMPVQQLAADKLITDDHIFVFEWMDELVGRFLTRNVQKMVGYAVSQSRNYGLKTERYTSMKNVVETVEGYIQSLAIMKTNEQAINKLILKDSPALIAELVKMPHVKECEILNGAGGTQMAPAIEVCGKQFPLTAAFSTMLKSLKASLAQYGDRVKKYDGEGVDWKALSHAIRITEQVLELTTTGKLVFPCANADYLKEVKEGKRTLEDATNYLTTLFNVIDDAVANSHLQERTPELDEQYVEFKTNLLRKYYLD